MTYELDGAQYVAVMAGFGGALGGVQPAGTAAERYGNAGRIVAFKLDGGAVPLPAELQAALHCRGRRSNASARRSRIETGNELLKRHCARCHANEATGAIPDLRRMSAATHQQFEDIVIHGMRADKGMGAFAGVINAKEAEAIRAAIVASAWDAYEASSGTPKAAPHVPPKTDTSAPKQ